MERATNSPYAWRHRRRTADPLGAVGLGGDHDGETPGAIWRPSTGPTKGHTDHTVVFVSATTSRCSLTEHPLNCPPLGGYGVTRHGGRMVDKPASPACNILIPEETTMPKVVPNRRRSILTSIALASGLTTALLVGTVPSQAKLPAVPHHTIKVAPTAKVLARATATVTVKARTQRMSGGSLNSRCLGTLAVGYKTTAGCRIIGQTHSGHYGTSNLWWDTPVGWLPDADVLGSVNVPNCVTRRAIGVKESSNTAPYGQCTWKAKDMFRRAVGASPALYGDAAQWLASARTAGYTTVLDAPSSAKAIVVFQPGVQGAGSVGHVAWLLSTEQRSDGRYITIIEHNWNGQGAVDHTRTIKDVVGMSYILAA